MGLVEAFDEPAHLVRAVQPPAHEHHHTQPDRCVVSRLGMFPEVAGHTRIG